MEFDQDDFDLNELPDDISVLKLIIKEMSGIKKILFRFLLKDSIFLKKSISKKLTDNPFHKIKLRIFSTVKMEKAGTIGNELLRENGELKKMKNELELNNKTLKNEVFKKKKKKISPIKSIQIFFFFGKISLQITKKTFQW